jgi:hypothetical protein
MKRSLLVALFSLSVLVSSAATAAGTISTTSPYATSFPLCSGGSVYLTGLVHSVERESESESTISYRLTGTNEATGDRYRFNATVVSNFAGNPEEDVFVQTFLRNVRLIGLAGAESYRAQALIHVTVIDGTVASSIERIETSC